MAGSQFASQEGQLSLGRNDAGSENVRSYFTRFKDGVFGGQGWWKVTQVNLRPTFRTRIYKAVIAP